MRVAFFIESWEDIVRDGEIIQPKSPPKWQILSVVLDRTERSAF